MLIPFTAVLLGAFFMAATNESIQVEPGKQLPQSVTVHAEKSAESADKKIRYLLFAPKDYKADGKKWPLLLFLHGLGECSNDDLNRAKIHGPANLVDSRPDFPFVVVTPQCSPPPAYAPGSALSMEQVRDLVDRAWNPDQLIQLIDHVSKNMNVDPSRIYVTGLSMGGYGTWRLAATYPDRIAAAVPICGGGEPDAMAKTLATVPIWAFHGGKATTVPPSESEKMVDAIKQAGGRDVKLTIYPDAQHNSWSETYANPEVYAWLLSKQSK